MSSPSHRGVVGAEPAGSACSAGGSPAPGPSPSASALSFPNRRSRRPDGIVEVITAVVGAPAAAAARPADAFPARPTRVVCPNLPQRPRSSRSTREETLIFRAFLRGRYRREAPLWQIWTRPRPGSPQEPHSPHADAPRITFHERNRSDPRAAESGARRRPYRPRWRRRSSGRASTASATSSASGSPPRPAACCPGIMP